MMSDLSARQLAFALAESYDFVHTTDLIDLGGETDTLLFRYVSELCLFPPKLEILCFLYCSSLVSGA